MRKGRRRVGWLVVTGHGAPFEANYPPFGVSQLHRMTKQMQQALMPEGMQAVSCAKWHCQFGDKAGSTIEQE